LRLLVGLRGREGCAYLGKRESATPGCLFFRERNTNPCQRFFGPRRARALRVATSRSRWRLSRALPSLVLVMLRLYLRSEWYGDHQGNRP
jgi:hypothetical protein